MKILIALCAVFALLNANAQLAANAGRDTTVCAGSPVVLGGNPTVSGGTVPYTYSWMPNVGLNCDTCANPVAMATSSAAFALTVVDGVGDTATDTVYLTVNALPVVNITASDTVICVGQQIYLQGSGTTPGCGLTGACNQTNMSPQLGNGTILQPGDALHYPTIFGNYLQSCRQQILYKAAELEMVLGGASTIDNIGFYVGVFNSNAYLENFTIRMGCTDLDSLTDWDNSLFNVINPFNDQPGSGWNDFVFNSGFYWDGVSNLVVEICWNSFDLFDNQNNKSVCSITTNSSYIYSAGANNQCDTANTPVASNIRPNVRFGYCSNPTLPSSASYQWQPAMGPDSAYSNTTINTYAFPVNSTTYHLIVTGNNGCVGADSVNITVRPVSVTASVQVTNAICPGQSNGAISAAIFSNDSVYFQLLNSNYMSLHSGNVVNNDTLLFAGLAAGTYHLLLSDSLCTNIDKAIVVGERLLIADTTLTNPTCPVLTNGVIHAILYAQQDSISYKLLDFNSTAVLDSGVVADSGAISFSSLVAGTYPLVISDSICTTLYDITLYAPPQPTYSGNSFTPSCYGDSTSSGCLSVAGGTPPLNFVWSDPAINGKCPANMPGGNYTVTVTDGNNCSMAISNVVVPQNPEITVQQIGAHPWFNSDSITLSITGGTSPYAVYWGDSSSSEVNNTAGHWYTNNPTQYIIITDANGCTVYDTVATVYIIGILQDAAASIKLFPNPASDQLFIEANQLAIDEIEVLDIAGKQVLHQYLNSVHQSVLNISGLSDGVYLLNAKSAGLEYRSRFVKMQ